MKANHKRSINWRLVIVHLLGAWLLMLAFRQLFHFYFLEWISDYPTSGLDDAQNAVEYLYQKSEQTSREEVLTWYGTGVAISYSSALVFVSISAYIMARANSKPLLHAIIVVLAGVLLLVFAYTEIGKELFNFPAYIIGVVLQLLGARQHYFIKGMLIAAVGMYFLLNKKLRRRAG